ncbi:oligosaccharide flippase family protein [Ideonella sp. B508-1]|uniref:oligosaccharide flippase family protein n=1 Tax=Ideonella sp. B508-1 TaxID=137716 RepID=UPI000A048289|nr:oligosaccharide flippase family protein [Ideonella sp. B508-1]
MHTFWSSANILFPQWLFQGLEQLRFVSLAQIGARLIVFAATFALVRHKEDLRLATALQTLGPLLGGLLALPQTFKALSLSRMRWPQYSALRHQLHEGWHVFLSSAAINIYTSCNAFFLGLLAPASAVGHYHVAEKLIRAVQMMLSPISNAVYPHVSRLAAENPQALIQFNRKLLAAMTACGAIFTVFVLLLAPWGISLLFGSGYEDATPVLRVMACLPLLVAMSNVLGIQTMLPLGMKQAFSRVLLVSAVLDILLFLPAASLSGALGAAWTNVLVELFVTVAMAWGLHQKGFSLFGRATQK